MARHVSAARVDTTRQVYVRVPVGLAPEDAVFARLAAVSLTSLRLTTARSGDRAAVVGLGLVGNLAAQQCELAGLPTTRVDLSPYRCAVARRCGLTTVLQAPAETDLEDRHRLVIEATGTVGGVRTALALARIGGEISLVGAAWGRSTGVPAQQILAAIFIRMVSVHSGWEWQLPLLEKDARYSTGSIEHNVVHLPDVISQRKLRVREVRTHRLSPTDAQAAYEGLVEDKEHYLGVVFDWTMI
jgi:threonine dehydrogenase-like Zn-dependent dehydrogenase